MTAAIVIIRQPELEVEPGGSVSCAVSVHNISSIVEQFTIEVIGETSGWASVEPPTLSLFPNTQQEVLVTWHPPREWHVAPGAMPFGVLVRPANDRDNAVVEEGTLRVEEYQAINAELVPSVTMGRRAGRLGVAIDSRSNVPVPAIVRGRDASDTLAINVRPRELTLLPGTANFVKLKVIPRHRYLRGPQRQARFKVTVEPEGGELISLDATMIQRPMLPKGSTVGMAAIGALLVFVYFNNKVKNDATTAAQQAIQPAVAQVRQSNAKTQASLVAVSKQVTKVQKTVNSVAKTTTSTTARNGNGNGNGANGTGGKVTSTSTTTTVAPTTSTSTTTTSTSTTTTSTTTTTIPRTTTSQRTTTTTSTTTTTTTTTSTTTTTTTLPPTTSSTTSTTLGPTGASGSSTTSTTAPPNAAGNQIAPGPYIDSINVNAPPGQTAQGIFVIPSGNTLDVTDLTLQNTQVSPGSFMQVGVEAAGSSTPRYFFTESLDSTTPYQIHLNTPFVLTPGETLVDEISCAGGNNATELCSGSVVFDGTIQLNAG